MVVFLLERLGLCFFCAALLTIIRGNFMLASFTSGKVAIDCEAKLHEGLGTNCFHVASSRYLL